MMRYFSAPPRWRFLLCAVLLSAVHLSACAKPLIPVVAHASPPAVLSLIDKAGIRDERARFRKIINAVIELVRIGWTVWRRG